MTRRAWVRLDNASNIFLAARSDVDPKVFRMSAEMDHEVDGELLEQALDATFDRYPLYHAVLRKGLFWYYLQDSDLRPQVQAEVQPTCAAIYRENRRELLFRVMRHRRRIVLEVFHALSDGTGALAFLRELVIAYARARTAAGPAPAGHGDPASTSSGFAVDPTSRHGRGLFVDPFARYFRRERRPSAAASAAEASAFVRAATPAGLPEGLPAVEPAASPRRRMVGRGPRRHETHVHRVPGTRTPDGRTRAVELTVPVAELLATRPEGVGTTMHLTALLFEAVRRSAGDLGRARTLAASVPVNLRQFFPSTSSRNFFTALRVEHTYGEGPDDLGAIGRQLEADFRPQIEIGALEERLRRLMGLERMPVLRIIPRPLKDLVLGLVNRVNNRALTVAVSNMGPVRLPEDVADQVRRVSFQVSAVRPQICVISYGGWLSITFTSPFLETGHVREFARLLTAQGIPVSVAATRVTEAELAEGAA